MKKQIYIIGNPEDACCKAKIVLYYETQLSLMELGFVVINPMVRFEDKLLINEEARRKNLLDLMNSDAIYIMPHVELSPSNLELKFAIDFDLVNIASILDFTTIE